jgi:hypothetical protein
MRAALLASSLFFLSCVSQAAEAHILKVLPTFLDERGRKAISPSLYERDAYQADLRRHPERVTGLRFDVNWKARGIDPTRLKLRIEMRTADRPAEGGPLRIEAPVSGRGTRRRWSSVTLGGDSYRRSGVVLAWRAVLLDGEQVVAEQRSFLW